MIPENKDGYYGPSRFQSIWTYLNGPYREVTRRWRIHLPQVLVHLRATPGVLKQPRLPLLVAHKNDCVPVLLGHPECVIDERFNNVKRLLPDVTNEDRKRYWRRVIRMAALCHDIGHLPFSHTSEDLLPKGWNHERMTAEIIRSPNRMDYLLRDSYHAGVTYGKFDHYRLIDTLRILTPPATKRPSAKEVTSENGSTIDKSMEISLGTEEGGHIHAKRILARKHYKVLYSRNPNVRSYSY